MPLGRQLELDEVPGAVVVDVVAGADTRGPGLVVVDRDLPGGGVGARRAGDPSGGGGLQGIDQRRVASRAVLLPLRHLEDHLHVVGGAEAPDPPVEIPPGGGGDEVVVLTGSELQTSRRGTEVPEGDGEVLELLRLVADGHNLGSGTCHTTGLELVLADAVDDVLLQRVLGTDDIELVVLPGEVAVVDVHDVVGVVYPEDGVGAVPVDHVDLCHCCG